MSAATREIRLRPGTPEDAQTIAGLAVQVFLDTYATEGVRPDLAAEVFAECSADAFSDRLRRVGRRFLLAERSSGLVGFAEVQVSPRSAPAGAVEGAELVRLYIQPSFQRRGIGHRLLQEAESAVSAAVVGCLWLTAWEGNHRARSFYAAHGYQDVGSTGHSFQGHRYVNRVFVKQLSTGGGA